MEELRQNNEVSTYPLRTITRLTGLSPELLRAWERRYNAIRPLRTAGGTRRYTNQDLERLKLLKAVVDYADVDLLARHSGSSIVDT